MRFLAESMAALGRGITAFRGIPAPQPPGLLSGSFGARGGAVAFDDRKTEPLIVVGCLSAFCGLAAAVVGRLFGVWWGLLSAALPVVVWAALNWIWRRRIVASDRAEPA